MEVELKLFIRPQDIASFKKHPLLKKYAQSAPVVQEQVGIYFDTETHELRKSDAGLRVRLAAKVWTQTLKAGGSVVNGLHQRHEWESVVHRAEPDLYALRKMIDVRGAWDHLLASPKFAARLRPIFTTTVSRTIWQLQLSNGSEIECVLDQGNISHADRNDAVSEVELELKSGKASHLFGFALELLKKVPLRIENLSKAERGYILHAQEKPGAVKAESLRLSKNMTMNQAFATIVENCLRQVQANAPGVIAADSIESLHQMRIGLRRLRSALRLFQKLITLPEDLKEELEWLSDAISAARDWDVLATKTLATIRTDAVDDELDEVRQAALAKAVLLHQVAASAVDSVRYTRLILSLAHWLQDGAWRESLPPLKGKDLRKRLKMFSQDMLEKDQQRLKKRGRQLKDADAKTRHRVRIAAKKMRYDTEFFQSLYPSRETKEYVAALADLQDGLGSLNDIAVGDELLSQIEKDQSELTGITDFIRGYLAARAAEDERKVKKLWKKFKAKQFPE
ncbi:MAG: CHAD domain-containing protein [Burkholderiaceae bacterium]|nr:CHAD domain-containing protein [Burkholderiaceae bacterium]